jgi:hypothetical protein
VIKQALNNQAQKKTQEKKTRTNTKTKSPKTSRKTSKAMPKKKAPAKSKSPVTRRAKSVAASKKLTRDQSKKRVTIKTEESELEIPYLIEEPFTEFVRPNPALEASTPDDTISEVSYDTPTVINEPMVDYQKEDLQKASPIRNNASIILLKDSAKPSPSSFHSPIRRL